MHVEGSEQIRRRKGMRGGRWGACNLLIGIVGLDEALVHNLARNRPVHGVVHDRAVPCCEHLQLVL